MSFFGVQVEHASADANMVRLTWNNFWIFPTATLQLPEWKTWNKWTFYPPHLVLVRQHIPIYTG
jgi:hypothetical protein